MIPAGSPEPRLLQGIKCLDSVVDHACRWLKIRRDRLEVVQPLVGEPQMLREVLQATEQQVEVPGIGH